MIDYTNRGKPCSVKRYTRTLTHVFRGGEQGVVVAESLNGVGRKIASIHWNGEQDFGPLFSDEIELLPEAA